MSPYAWIIEKDHLDVGVPTSVGVKGPRDADPDLVTLLSFGEGALFRLYDDDDELYFEGHIIGDFDGFEPLEDYGMPAAGCTGIKYPGRPELGGGKYL